ncbi:MAG: type II secretion system protein GspM [Polaromonas sp.]
MSTNTFNALVAKWRAISPRYQARIGIAFALLMLAVLWWALVAQPLGILLQASEQRRMLDSDWQKMQSLKIQSQRLLSLPKMSRDDSLRALEASVRQLGGSTQLDVSADRITLSLRAVPAEALAKWLAQARVNAHTQPLEARLTRAAGPIAAWDGLLVLGLPAK